MTVGGRLNNGACNFRFSDFDNIAEDKEHYQIFAEVTHDFATARRPRARRCSPTTRSRSGTPRRPIRPSRCSATTATWARACPTSTTSSPAIRTWLPTSPAAPWSSAEAGLGSADRQGQVGSEYDTYRIAGGLTGEFDNGLILDASLTYGTSEGTRTTNDTRMDRCCSPRATWPTRTPDPERHADGGAERAILLATRSPACADPARPRP
ncbi:MAG: hypothetical protein U5R48_11960 [Gammaproteobacteria bacterium]|nr:hypothetical protein [Gammaproteobacteria bacterium]